MSIFEAVLLGLIQGATEFLPISSSGHLVLVPAIFDITQPDLTLVGLLHLATLLAVVAYFRHDLWQIATAVGHSLKQGNAMRAGEAWQGWLIIFGSIPTALIGLLAANPLGRLFSSPDVSAAFLLVTAALLLMGERLLSGQKDLQQASWRDAVAIGLFQTLALLPGISRSGSTIVGSLVRGLDRPTATRFSFLLGVPVILGAGLLSLMDIVADDSPAYSVTAYVAAFLAATLSGYLCIHLLLRWVRNHSLTIFAVYCAAFGVLYLLLSFLGT